MPRVRFPEPLREKLRGKETAEQGALLRCFDQLAADPRHPGLRTSKLQGAPGVFEARAGRASRVTWEWDEGVIVILNHCRHDDVYRRPRG